MRLVNEAPSNPREQAIEDVLVAVGYEPKEIQFRHKGEDGNHETYLRIGYWEKLDNDIIAQMLKNYIGEEVADFDEDCGYLFWYHIK